MLKKKGEKRSKRTRKQRKEDKKERKEEEKDMKDKRGGGRREVEENANTVVKSHVIMLCRTYLENVLSS
jgi:hypothetical protein